MGYPTADSRTARSVRVDPAPLDGPSVHSWSDLPARPGPDTARRARPPGRPPAGTATRQAATRPNATRPPGARGAAGPGGAPPAARPPGAASGGSAGPHRPHRNVPLRLALALLVTVGAVILLGLTEDADESTDEAGADCASRTSQVSDVSAVQARNARIITQVAIDRGLGPEAAEIAVATSLAETGLINFANDGTSELYAAEIDRPLSDIEREVARRSLGYPHDEVGNNLDSIGLFQQRPTTGWGAPEKLIDPASASGLFYDRLEKIADWRSGVPWQTAQKVQSSPSADGGIYQKSYERAVGVVAALMAQPPCTLA